MRRHVKLMPAYLCPPIWLYRNRTGVPRNVEARWLPLPDALVERIEAWDATFQRTRETGGFTSEAELADHVEEGLLLAHEMAQVLSGWATATIFEPNADLSAAAHVDPEWTLVSNRQTRFDVDETLVA